MTKTKTHSRAAAMLLAILMMFGTLFASMTTVSAANEGTLNIHKLSQTSVLDANKETGKTYYTKAIDENYEYLAGAKYTVYKIGTFAETNVSGTVSTVFTPDANLVMVGSAIFGSSTTPGDIDLAASKTAGLTGSAETNATTAAGPLAITSGLDTNGVYLIVESTLPSGVSAGADFIITVPMYNATSNAWETTVNAYPKNTASNGAIAKTITGGTGYANVGDTVAYSVGVTVPSDYATTDLDPAKNYTKFNLIDESSKYLELKTASATLVDSDITIIGASSGTFTATTDYTVAYDTTGTTNKLTVTFTATGLAKIQAGEILTITYGAEIQTGATSVTGGLVNRAYIDFTKGTGTGTITPPPTDPPVTIKIYSYGVKKMDDATTPAPLAGATFKLAIKNGTGYDYLSYNATTEVWSIVTEATAQVFTTTTSAGTATAIGDEAILQFKNLDSTKTYCLFETAAPTGYIKLANPVEFTATSTTTDAVYNTYNASGVYQADTGYTVKITNVSTTNGGLIGGGGLPTTGGNGIYLYLIIGTVLMGSAVVFYVSKNRKKNKAAQ